MFLSIMKFLVVLLATLVVLGSAARKLTHLGERKREFVTEFIIILRLLYNSDKVVQ